MSFRSLALVKEERIAVITLDHPQEGNALSDELAQELAEACALISQDNEVWAVVLEAAGRSFCTGGDAPYAVEAVAAIEQPVVAALQGDVLGMGLALACACDLRLASPGARLGVPQLLTHPGGLTQRLPRLVGRGRALEMLLMGGVVDSTQAQLYGLVNQVATVGNLTSLALEWGRRLVAKSPIAARLVKEAVAKGMDLTLDQGLRLEADLYFLLHTTGDRTEGISAFLSKRPPQFKGD
ncbi:MAG: enoyl-CoA hydratase-related protein [Dehalococcoidia bacterium]|jgi:enoyl-CoA hydratase|nr:enoyl-CoA hydratase-related protein [Dehalococcoidia bacterium]